MLLGKGGAGKSTLLARWVYLGLTSQLPASLRGFRPVLVPASYYEKSLLKAIADTLRERDGIAVDESVVQAQLQSGKYLILFDGISEVDSDKLQAINDIIRTARNADFQNCRFLISTRPLEGIPADVSTFQLQPLTVNVILDLLPRYDLERERENLLRRQLQSFGDKPVEPLLFTMALDQSGSGQLSTTRSQLYERYFRRLLRAESDETSWAGWRAALEKLAEWFLLDTGRRGVGLPYEPLVDLIAGKKGDGAAAGNLLERLRRFYRLPAKDELDLLQHLQASGLLQGGRRWRFAHDTFEEYFAASCLVSRLDKDDQLPRLDKWIGIHEQEVEFCEVLDFVKEMTDAAARRRIVKIGVPASWQERLEKDNAGHPGPT
jgi:predicted NACHT family NTPase